MAEKGYLAIDMGASSGRHVVGLFDGRKLELGEAHRFENGPVNAAGRLYWDLLGLWNNILAGMRAARSQHGRSIRSIGVDTWGVDFALLGRGDEILGNPYNYRDARTAGMVERAFEIVSRDEIFAETGLQFMELNTLYQLLSMRLADSPLLESAETLLMMPDLFHWLLTGEKANEMTDVSTSQLYNPLTGTWSASLIEKFGLPARIFGPIVQPGAKIGPLLPRVVDETGLAGVEVILPGTHDTASAVLAVPAAGEASETPNWCYISSGTWSLMGVEVSRPVVNETCARLNFTNEGGVGGTTRLLKNIAGLWLVQECRRIWSLQGRDYPWDELNRLAAEAPPLVSVINPDDPSLVAPNDMPEAIRALCRASGQQPPDSEGAVIRCALESLALRYRQVLGWLEELTGQRIERIHIVGGGTQNRMLSQMAADACNRPVVAGPVEATAIGNILMQAIAAGDLASISEARELVKSSFGVEQFTPQATAPWDEAFEMLK